MDVGWRAMTERDLDAAFAIAAVVHPDYPEDRAVFAERRHLFPAGCRFADRGGYAVMHPARLGRPPALDSLLGSLPEDADCLYLHDVALLPAARGHGLGEAALAHALHLARVNRLGHVALTSTPPARAFWDRHGFAPFDGGPALAAKLASYGEGMAYLVRPVTL